MLWKNHVCSAEVDNHSTAFPLPFVVNSCGSPHQSTMSLSSFNWLLVTISCVTFEGERIYTLFLSSNAHTIMCMCMCVCVPMWLRYGLLFIWLPVAPSYARREIHGYTIKCSKCTHISSLDKRARPQNVSTCVFPFEKYLCALHTLNSEHVNTLAYCILRTSHSTAQHSIVHDIRRSSCRR